MDADRALADLLDLCGDIEAAIVLDGDTVLASSLDESRTDSFAAAVRDVVSVAERVKPGGAAPVERVAAALAGGRFFVVSRDQLVVAAATGAAAAPALVLHDLSTLLHELTERRTAGARA